MKDGKKDILMTQGYTFVAIGERHIQECRNLCITIRKQGDNRPFSIITHSKDIEFTKSLNIFSDIIPLRTEGPLWDDCTSDFERYCVYPRITINDYLIYDETITTDTDMLCQYPTEHVWSFCTNRTVPIATTGKPYDPTWHWNTIADVWKACDRHVPHVNGGFKYIRRGAFANNYFATAQHVFLKYDDYGCKRWFRQSRTEEVIFAIAHAFSGIMPVDFREYPIQTFEYFPGLVIPSKMQFEGNSPYELNGYPPFVHMPDKINGDNYKWLFKTIMDAE